MRLEIPYGTEKIKRGKYKYRTDITEVIIPPTVTSIGDEAFAWCKNLKSVTIPGSVKSIGIAAFYGCINLTKVAISNGVKSIGIAAFAICSRLTNIAIPDSVVAIGGNAFDCCTNLTNISFGKHYEVICMCTFGQCKKLKSIPKNYKAFYIENGNELWCLDYKFTPNEWSEKEYEIELDEKGYHYCTNLYEIFDYYCGDLNNGIAIYECEVGDWVKKSKIDSTCVTNTIKPIRRIYKDEIIKILNGEQI